MNTDRSIETAPDSTLEGAQNLPRWLLPTLLLGLGALAWSRRFILDDAFISFRYAQNLARGEGLVWNSGEWVEGYTNFAWTVWLSLAFSLDLDPVLFAQVSGWVAFLAGLTALWFAARALLVDRVPAVVAVLLLGMTPTFNAYATGGLETSLQAALLTAALAMALTIWRAGGATVGKAAALSAVLGLVVLTRMDSAVIGAWIGLATLTFVVVGANRESPSIRPVVLALVVPFSLLIGAWLWWKSMVYGDLLPNTYYAKTGAEGAWGRGLNFLWMYLRSSMLFPAALIALPGIWVAMRDRHGPALLGWGALGSWLIYVASVGGDFMEFRFLVAAMPLAVLLLVWTLWSAIRWPLLRAIVVASTLMGGLLHQTQFEGRDGVESIDQLASHLTHEVQDWEGVGKTLYADLGADSSARIATTAAGAIPYYSELPAVDMLGLTDGWIARNGKRVSLQVAHHRLAPLSYLVEREVHLVLGQPWLRRAVQPPRTQYPFHHLREFHALAGERAADFPPTSSIVEVPLSNNRVLVVLYLTPHEDVERAIANAGWRRIPIVAASPNATL
jgi:arabinofuranosyltransferase